MSELKERLQEELDSGGPGKFWYGLIHRELKIAAGKWPPKDFVEFEPDAVNSNNWRFSEKLDLTQKFFEDEILNPTRGAISFIMTATTDSHVRTNIREVINQFLSEVTKGADDKRVFKLIGDRLAASGFILVPPSGGVSTVPTVQSNSETASRISRILMTTKNRLPNAFAPAGEGERNSPIWAPQAYDEIAAKIVGLPGPVTEEALRAGISDALTHLRFALYYADDIPEEVVAKDKNVYRGEEGGVDMVSTIESLMPLDDLLVSEEFNQAREILGLLSSESRRFLHAMSRSTKKTEIAENLGVSRVTALKLENKMVKEVNAILDEIEIPDADRQGVRTALRVLSEEELSK